MLSHLKFVSSDTADRLMKTIPYVSSLYAPDVRARVCALTEGECACVAWCPRL